MITPTREYRGVEVRRPERIHAGLDAWVHGVAGRFVRGDIRLGGFLREAERIDRLCGEFSALSDRRLRERLEEYRGLFRRAESRSAARVGEALAAVREAAGRQTGLRPYPVQVAGSLALHAGCLAEMATGEGKTLTAACTAVLAGWTGRPCHIVTVNDYLARRDAEWFEPLYRFCGVEVGCVTADMDPPARRAGYARDVTYTTSKEVVADFLRDRLRLGLLQHPTRRLVRGLLRGTGPAADLVMRGLHTAIVDEADSVLIDEAVTPLIIAQPRDNRALREACEVACRLARELENGRHYRTDARYREVELLGPGFQWLEDQGRRLPGIWKGEERRRELIEQALTAREFFHRDRQYVVQDGRVTIVDEFTGRLMPNRNWSEGLHQAVQAKEGLAVTEPDETLARLSFQRYFRLYHRLAGMTGTAREAAAEFWQIYRLPVVTIPTNRPCIRREEPDRLFTRAEAKWEAIAETIARVHVTGRPVLAGTRSVGASEELAARLAALGLPCHVLNAVRHREEAKVVAAAGQPGQITIATNMAGRGTDIRLGDGVAEAGGLQVLATERHESGRIDRQLFGRCARQGDPGGSQAFVSLEDELMRRFVPAPVRKRLTGLLASDPERARPFVQSAVRFAQRSAQSLARKQRHNVLRADHWLDEALSFAGSGYGR